MPKGPTLADLAAAAGLSLSTIDRILNRRGPVQQSTVLHVLATARQIGFHAVPLIQQRLAENAPQRVFGFLLNSRSRVLYSAMARQLESRTRASVVVRGQARIGYLEDISAQSTARALLELAEGCDALAVVSIDSPEVRAAIDQLAARGVPVWTMLSDVESPHRAGFVGADPLRLGRGGGWFVERLLRRPGPVALLMGSQDYSAHRGYVAGFRDYFTERGGHARLLPTEQTLESDERAEEIVTGLHARHPDLAAVMVAGGGLDGVIRALAGNTAEDRVILVGTELSESAEMGLQLGAVDALLSHASPIVVERVIAAMEQFATSGTLPSGAGCHDFVPIDIRIREVL